MSASNPITITRKIPQILVRIELQYLIGFLSSSYFAGNRIENFTK